jgi:hypothetical protein
MMKRSESKIHGEFFVDFDNEFSFVCHTHGDATFNDVESAFKQCIAEITRQMNERAKCPYYSTVQAK